MKIYGYIKAFYVFFSDASCCCWGSALYLRPFQPSEDKASHSRFMKSATATGGAL